jgi:hypothetical protein
MAFYDGTVIADGAPDIVLSNPEVQTLISGVPRTRRAAPHA